jgi:hypothetical protein
MKNYKAIIADFADIAAKHAFINRFGSGAIDDVNVFAPTSAKYPYLWVIPQGALLGSSSIQYQLRVMVFDIDRSTDELRDEIMSDTLLTINDVISIFRNGGSDNEYEVTADALAIPFEQKFVDYCVGWYCDLTVATDSMSSDRGCAIPLD